MNPSFQNVWISKQVRGRIVRVYFAGGGPRDVVHQRVSQPHPLRYDVQKFQMWFLSGTKNNIFGKQ